MEMNGRNAGEIAKARGMLEAQQTKLQQIRSAMQETKSEMLELDLRHHNLQATGDINKMMAIKSRSIALNKSVSGLTASEAECRQRVESMERYVETLNKKLEGLRHEASRLAEEIGVDGVAPDVKAKLHSLASRIKMQIEALEGKKRSGPIRLS
jgi:predicted nuclease with TOPRIM domain